MAAERVCVCARVRAWRRLMCMGGLKQTGQAGCWSILSLNLHRWRSIRPLQHKHKHTVNHQLSLNDWCHFLQLPCNNVKSQYAYRVRDVYDERWGLTLIRLCSGRLQAAIWSCRSCWEKFWCICAASCASIEFPQALFKSVQTNTRHLCLNTDVDATLV